LPGRPFRLAFACAALFCVGAITLAGNELGQSPAAGETPNLERVRAFDAAWQLVKDTHFDRSLNGVDWDRVREELRPRAAAARTDEELRAVIADMVSRLGQSHFYVLPGASPEAARAPVGTRNETPVPSRYASSTVPQWCRASILRVLPRERACGQAGS
jgi:carboxyl-terminal processing protease